MRGATPLPLCKRKVERRKRPRVFVAASAVLENLKGALSPRLSAVCSVDDSFSRSLSSCCPFFIARGSGGKKEKKKKNVNHQRSWLLVHGERIRRHVGFMLLASLVGQRWADAPCRISGAIFCFSRRVFSGAGLYSSNPPPLRPTTTCCVMRITSAVVRSASYLSAILWFSFHFFFLVPSSLSCALSAQTL